VFPKLKRWLLGKGRVHCNADLTLLGWPGRRFRYAHYVHRVLYGEEKYRWYRDKAQERHRERVEEGCTFELRQSYHWRWYRPWAVHLHAKKPPKPAG
jgi:hypothetical protein